MSQPRDPERLAEAPSPLGKLMASAIRDEPSMQQLADLAQRLAGPFEPAPASPSTHGSSLMAKLGVAGGVAALLAGGALMAHRSAPRSPRIAQSSVLSSARVNELAPFKPTPVTPPPPDAAAPQQADPPASSPGHDAALPPRVTSRIEATGPTPSAARGLRDLEAPSEARLLEQARKVLNASPAAALSLTDQHAARFPHGVLVQEREVIAVEALRRLHRTAEADRRAAAFARAFPGSAHQRMVEDGSSK